MDSTHISCIGRQTPYHWATRGLSLAYVNTHPYKNWQPHTLRPLLPPKIPHSLFMKCVSSLNRSSFSLLWLTLEFFPAWSQPTLGSHPRNLALTWDMCPISSCYRTMKRHQYLLKDSGSSPTCSVYTGALHPGQTPPSCCFLTIKLPCMLISLTGIISSGIVHKWSGHFAELLTGMRAFIWKVPLNKKSEEILKRRFSVLFVYEREHFA